MKASQEYSSGKLATAQVEFSPQELKVLQQFETLMKKN